MVRRLLAIVFLFLAVPVSLVHAQIPSKDTYQKARVDAVTEQGEKTVNNVAIPYQVVRVTMLDGALKGKQITIDHGSVFSIDKSKFVTKGETVVVVQTIGPDYQPTYHIVDTYRLNALVPFLLLFMASVIVLSGWRGAGSIIGMGISLAIIAGFIVPRIMAGSDPLTVTIAGCVVILTTTMYLAHGFTRQTTVALVSTAVALLLTGILAVIITHATKLTGLGSEDAYSLKLGPTSNLNFRGLLLGGIMIGALGVLDDVTTGLAASVFELFGANPKLSFARLVAAGLRVGREHIASLVNTLVLAYAGASLPIFIILITNPNGYPAWTTLNSEMIVEEIVRTLTGSIGLILAVPLTTVFAAWHLTRRR